MCLHAILADSKPAVCLLYYASRCYDRFASWDSEEQIRGKRDSGLETDLMRETRSFLQPLRYLPVAASTSPTPRESEKSEKQGGGASMRRESFQAKLKAVTIHV
eukprot:3412730-Pleurochrysis_carterae.AAC.2